MADPFAYGWLAEHLRRRAAERETLPRHLRPRLTGERAAYNERVGSDPLTSPTTASGGRGSKSSERQDSMPDTGLDLQARGTAWAGFRDAQPGALAERSRHRALRRVRRGSFNAGWDAARAECTAQPATAPEPAEHPNTPDLIEGEIWRWLNRHNAPWSPSDAKVRDLAVAIAAAVGAANPSAQ